jgi:hypothetical protein
MSVKTSLMWKHFHQGKKQNSTQYHSHCKACVSHHLERLKEERAEEWAIHMAGDASAVMQAKEALFKEGE